MRAAQGTLSPGGTTEPLRVPEPCAELGAWDAPTNPSRGPPSIARTGNLWCLRGREVPGGALAAPTLKGTHTSFVAVTRVMCAPGALLACPFREVYLTCKTSGPFTPFPRWITHSSSFISQQLEFIFQIKVCFPVKCQRFCAMCGGMSPSF